jgi:hypothetical protein
MQNTKIESTIEFIPTSTNGMCKMSREITNFNYDKVNKIFTPIVLEQLFKEQTIEIDGKTITERIIVNKNYRNFASKELTNLDVRELFSLLQKDILHTENFDEKFNDLLDDSILFDTKSTTRQGEAPLFDLLPEQWVKGKNNYVLVNKFTAIEE